MKSILKPVRSSFSADPVERILSRYFTRLAEWSQILTRGDHTAAEEIVQDLCLHLTVTQPDLSSVKDLDAYLYTCLRNMYISRLARVSRERLRVIQIEDYDQVGMVVAGSGSDSVDVQNELIRICDYVISRKYSSKSASHFILHFFLGYRRSDVALLARLPIAAIYNKLKDIRGELRKHLSSRDGIRIVGRGSPPEKERLRTALPTDVFLGELHKTVFDSDLVSCIPEAELIASYRVPDASPVDCRHLAHLAGCQRCLAVLERALQLEDRDGPLDGLGAEQPAKREANVSFDATMRVVRRRSRQLFERRPAILAIAVDGRVVAFHAVESAHSSLSSRVDAASTVHFIEVFDEFGDRLAHIALNAEAAATPRNRLSQQVLLSDDRSLRFEIRFDGLGIHAGADYTDPALAPSGAVDESSPAYDLQASWWSQFWRPGKFRIAHWGIAAFASVLLAAALGVAAYRYIHPVWREVIAHSQAAAEVPLPTETLHQTLRIEEATEPATGEYLGSVDVWRSSDRKEVRRFYDAHRQLLATWTRSADGSTSERLENNGSVGEKERQIVESGVWKNDVSVAAFDTGQGAAAEVFRGVNTIEVTQREDGSRGILSRTLLLDRNYKVKAETVRFRTAAGVSEVRLVQTLLLRVPNNNVPDSVFPRSQEMTQPGKQSQHSLGNVPDVNLLGNVGGANLEVALLFELFQRNVDVGRPIEVTPAAGGRIRVTGTLSDTYQLAAIRESVAALPNAGLVDFRIRSVSEAASAVRRGNTNVQELVGASGDAPAAGLVRSAMIARGLKGSALKTAEQDFAASALSHAQAALQHAYALDRLGIILRQAGRASLAPDIRVKWAQMADRHSAAAMRELDALLVQLNSVSTGIGGAPSIEANGIGDAEAFARAASDLRARAQSVNEEVVELFAGSTANLAPVQARNSLAHLQSALPLVEASRMNSFAHLLASRSPASQSEVGEMHTR